MAESEQRLVDAAPEGFARQPHLLGDARQRKPAHESQLQGAPLLRGKIADPLQQPEKPFLAHGPGEGVPIAGHDLLRHGAEGLSSRQVSAQPVQEDGNGPRKEPILFPEGFPALPDQSQGLLHHVFRQVRFHPPVPQHREEGRSQTGEHLLPEFPVTTGPGRKPALHIPFPHRRSRLDPT